MWDSGCKWVKPFEWEFPFTLAERLVEDEHFVTIVCQILLVLKMTQSSSGVLHLNCWLGGKHQFTYLFSSLACRSPSVLWATWSSSPSTSSSSPSSARRVHESWGRLVWTRPSRPPMMGPGPKPPSMTSNLRFVKTSYFVVTWVCTAVADSGLSRWRVSHAINTFPQRSQVSQAPGP